MGDVIDLSKARAEKKPPAPSGPDWAFTADFYNGGTGELIFDVSAFNEDIGATPAERLRIWADLLTTLAGCVRTDADALDPDSDRGPVVAVALMFKGGKVRVRTFDEDLEKISAEDVDHLCGEVRKVMHQVQAEAGA